MHTTSNELRPRNESRPSRRWLFAAALVVVLLAVAGLFYYGSVWKDARADRPDERAADYLAVYRTFLADVDANRLDAAYQATTPEFRARVSREAFEQRAARYLAFQQRPGVRGVRAQSSGPIGGDYSGPNQMELTHTFEDVEGNRQQVSIRVVYQDSFFTRRPPAPKIGDFTVEEPVAAPPAGK